MTSLPEVVQQPSLDEFVELFELDATVLGGSIYRFLSSAYAATTVTWQGNIYTPIPVEASGFTADSSGMLPTPHLKVANIDLAFSGVAISFHDLLGSIVTRHRTFRRFLDGEADADPTAEYMPDVYRVDRKVHQNKVYVEWELATVIDQEGRIIPGRPVLQNGCTLLYRHWDGVSEFDYSKATCPYVGSTYFDINGLEVSNPALDKASKRLDTCCVVRFPGVALPFGGFPGVARF